nr:hypothetical protein [uncultured Roseateles sp.]
MALSLAGIGTLGLAAAPEAQVQAATQQFQAAAKGDASAVDKSAEAFAELLKAEPGNPLLMAYLGASTTMRASTTMLPWKKMSLVEDGLAWLDKALAMLQPQHDVPQPGHVAVSLETRFTAISTFLALPSMFNRGPRGAKLLSELLTSPQFAQAPLPFQGAVWMRAAKWAEQDKRPDDARKFYQLVTERNAPQAAQAGAQLKALQS